MRHSAIPGRAASFLRDLMLRRFGMMYARARGIRLLQPSTFTRMDRHPALFAVIAAQLADHPAPRLLSFGASTGEEAFSLAQCLPHARIDAIDANPVCIALARRAARRRGYDRIRFVCDDAPDAFGAEPYDVVVCLSVLRHGTLEAHPPERCSAVMPFSRFAEAIHALDRRVAPGGLLVLWGCHFRFADTEVASRYHALPTPTLSSYIGPLYGPDDRLMRNETTADFVFVKRYDADG